MGIKGDIGNEHDIKIMVDSFYEKVNKDDLLSPIFNDFSKVNWETHLPRMYAFWNKMAFAKSGYDGNPFQKHIPLPIDGAHFERWISIFVGNMDEHFSGGVAEDIKIRAHSIAYIFKSKLNIINKDKNHENIIPDK